MTWIALIYSIVFDVGDQRPRNMGIAVDISVLSQLRCTLFPVQCPDVTTAPFDTWSDDHGERTLGLRHSDSPRHTGHNQRKIQTNITGESNKVATVLHLHPNNALVERLE